MKKYLNVALALMLCLSLVGMTFVLSAPASAEDTGSISGCVSATATGDPIEGATVAILNRDTIGTGTPLIYETETATDGSYTATGLPPAVYVVAAIADLYAVEWYTYDYRDASR